MIEQSTNAAEPPLNRPPPSASPAWLPQNPPVTLFPRKPQFVAFRIPVVNSPPPLPLPPKPKYQPEPPPTQLFVTNDVSTRVSVPPSWQIAPPNPLPG